jgi:hypothetical protein
MTLKSYRLEVTKHSVETKHGTEFDRTEILTKVQKSMSHLSSEKQT